MDQKQLFLAPVDRHLESPAANPLASFRSIAIPQISTALISFLASTMMAIMIARTGPRLSLPYRRIIFGLSIADMAQSLGFLTGPISLPRDILNSWGLGDKITCEISGFLTFVGLLAVPMYTCFVCLYYLCKLKHRMSNESFAHKIERKIHALIILFVMVVALTALTLNTINPVASRTYCCISPSPMGCRYDPDPDVECDATIIARVDIFFTIEISLQMVCCMGMIGMMCMIGFHTTRQNRFLQPRGLGNRRPTDDAETLNEIQIQEEVLYLSSLYKKEIVLQTICYIGAFCLTYVPRNIIYVMVRVGARPSKNSVILIMSLVPLGGFFNILVYSRPQTASLKRAYPDRSWLLCFWLVLRAGGEVPVDHNQQNQASQHSSSSNDPFGEGNDTIQTFDRRGLPIVANGQNLGIDENWSLSPIRELETVQSTPPYSVIATPSSTINL